MTMSADAAVQLNIIGQVWGFLDAHPDAKVLPDDWIADQLASLHLSTTSEVSIDPARFSMLLCGQVGKSVLVIKQVIQAILNTVTSVKDLAHRAKILVELALFQFQFSQQGAQTLLCQVKSLADSAGDLVTKREVLLTLGVAQYTLKDPLIAETMLACQGCIRDQGEELKIRTEFYPTLAHFLMSSGKHRKDMSDPDLFCEVQKVLRAEQQDGAAEDMACIAYTRHCAALARIQVQFDDQQRVSETLKVCVQDILAMQVCDQMALGYMLPALVDLVEAQLDIGDQQASEQTLEIVKQTIQALKAIPLVNRAHPAFLSLAVAQARIGDLEGAFATATPLLGANVNLTRLWAAFAAEEAKQGNFENSVERALSLEEGAFKAQSLLSVMKSIFVHAVKSLVF